MLYICNEIKNKEKDEKSYFIYVIFDKHNWIFTRKS